VCQLQVISYPTVLYAGDGNVHIIDPGENVSPLRSFIAKTLDWLNTDGFLVSRMIHIEDISKYFLLGVYF
jgi:hypothetical protein